ncbi:MAG: acyl-ACP--UDP-N-acetylglucosamine O-acyltransferase [Rickettsiales bacterium]|nr:acyl-ACP--UDP-N-acetylglucosamine O-acyltransferase [Rickettsiales bacterium]
MPDIHPTAVVDPAATIANDVVIGAYCCIGPKVVLEAGVVLHSHVVVDGQTIVGEGTHIYPFASIGTPPQDLKYHGESSTLRIGKQNRIREHVTMNPGTEGGGMETVVGDHCLFMVGAHVAHDCHVGNHVILANNATLAGHVTVGEHAIIGGLSAVHQFVRIGEHAMIGGMSGIENDVIPYGQATGERAALVGLNLVGLKRRGFGREDIHALRGAYRMLFSPEGTLGERLEDVVEHFSATTPVMHVVDFIRQDSSRAICQPRNNTKQT